MENSEGMPAAVRNRRPSLDPIGAQAAVLSRRTILIRSRIMGVNWSKDIDQTLAAAKEQSRPVLLDFSAAPA